MWLIFWLDIKYHHDIGDIGESPLWWHVILNPVDNFRSHHYWVVIIRCGDDIQQMTSMSSVNVAVLWIDITWKNILKLLHMNVKWSGGNISKWLIIINTNPGKWHKGIQENERITSSFHQMHIFTTRFPILPIYPFYYTIYPFHYMKYSLYFFTTRRYTILLHDSFLYCTIHFFTIRFISLFGLVWFGLVCALYTSSITLTLCFCSLVGSGKAN
jgi:hypothetical protein